MSSLNSDTTVRYRKVNDIENESEEMQTNNLTDDSNLPSNPFENDLNPFNQPQTSVANTVESNDHNNYDLSLVLKKIYTQIDQLKYRLQKDTYRRCINNEWMLIGTLIDKILFFAYCLVVIVSTNSIFKS